MESIVHLKFAIFTSVGLIYFLPECLTEPYFSSMANITPVKLLHINPRNASLSNRRNDSVFGSVAKISRVVPLKHVTKDRYANFSNNSNANIKFAAIPSATKKKPTARLEYRSKAQVKMPLPVNNQSSHTVSNTQVQYVATYTTSVPPRASTTASTNFPTKPSTKRPLFLTADSWNYLNSAVTDNELRQIINGFSNEVIQNVTNITKHDPKEGENFLLQSIIHELSKLKKSRMLPLEEGKKTITIVNKGVRFSAKHRRPILNVVPLEQKLKLGKPVKNLIKTGLVEQWNISGVISNSDNSSDKANFKASPIYPGTTMSSLMHALAAPDKLYVDSTTSSPFAPNQPKAGFIPVIPFSSDSENNNASNLFKPTSVFQAERIIPKKEKSMEEENLPSSEFSTLINRKPREPPKDEYSIPSITTSSTATPEGSKGYQTITQSTTPGPKVIWYNHNQTPEDTFYPNSDPFLVPPEESSIEILADLLSVQPLPDDDVSLDTKPFSPDSSEIPYKYSSKIKGDRKSRPVLHYSSGENEDVIGSQTNWGSQSSREKNRKKNSIIGKKPTTALQLADSSDHDGIRDYYKKDTDSKNGGSSGINIYHDKKLHGAASYNGYDLKHHEIIPRYQKTNRKPPYREDDTENYGVFNDDGHYQSSYPPPPGANRHESGPHRYRSYQHHPDGPGEEEEHRIREGPNGRYKEERPSSDSDFYYPREPKYRLREHSPGYHGNHGWKRPSKDFLAKAKDYFKTSDFSTAEKWFEATIGILAFLAFGGYIIMLLYQVFAVSSGTSIGTLLGRGMKGAGEIFDLFFSKGPIGEAYLDELETIVKRAMANVKRIWKDKSFADKMMPKVKGEEDDK